MMVGNNLKQQQHKSEFYVAEIAGGNVPIKSLSLPEKARPSDDNGTSINSMVENCVDDVEQESTTSSDGVLSLSRPSTSSSKHCSLKEKPLFKRFRRNNRCKYCRRLVGSPTSLLLSKGGVKTLSPPLIPFTSRIRRPLDSPMDEVAWACGRLWCSVSRRKRRKISDNRTRKQINEAFSTLREILPPAAQTEHEDSAAAKVSTLRLAASYIQALSDLLRETHLTDKHPKCDDNREDKESDDLHLDQETSSTVLLSRHSSTTGDFGVSKKGSNPSTKFQNSFFTAEKKSALVKNITGSDTPLECV